MRLTRVMLCAALLLGAAVPSAILPPAGPAEAAEFPVLRITVPKAGKSQEIVFDRSGFEAIGTRTVNTSTSWTDGVKSVRVAAINDYSYTIPFKDVKDYPVILAFKMNGKYLTPRDKGPLWVIYPRDEFPELNTKEVDHRMVWQVNAMTVQ